MGSHDLELRGVVNTWGEGGGSSPPLQTRAHTRYDPWCSVDLGSTTYLHVGVPQLWEWKMIRH